mmetsp:Transcript_52159/g.118921  ORF Transcript_52159/g.118921 Transcript_52159/m.118921 type:complete len:330 (-) Transcript_52159:175-1164(-)
MRGRGRDHETRRAVRGDLQRRGDGLAHGRPLRPPPGRAWGGQPGGGGGGVGGEPRGRAASAPSRPGAEEVSGDGDERPVLPGAHGPGAPHQPDAGRSLGALDLALGGPGRLGAAQEVQGRGRAEAGGRRHQRVTHGPRKGHRRPCGGGAARAVPRVQADDAAPRGARRGQPHHRPRLLPRRRRPGRGNAPGTQVWRAVRFGDQRERAGLERVGLRGPRSHRLGPRQVRAGGGGAQRAGEGAPPRLPGPTRSDRGSPPQAKGPRRRRTEIESSASRCDQHSPGYRCSLGGNDHQLSPRRRSSIEGNGFERIPVKLSLLSRVNPIRGDLRT